MAGTNSSKTGLTRRSFLKTTAAAAGAAAIAGGATAGLTALAESDVSSNPEEHWGYTACRGNCYGGCFIKVKVRDGKAVYSEAADVPLNDDYKSICPKGLSFPQRAYGPARVKYPMRRVEGTPRGGGEWERISWDEAIEEICTKWKQYQEESGNTCININGLSGAGSAVSYHGAWGYLRGLLGATGFQAVDDGAGLSMVTQTSGFTQFQNGGSPASDRCAKTVFMVGCNAAIAYVQRFRFLLDAQDNGAKLIHIDPVYNLTSEKADWYVPIRPCSDTALFLGMIHETIANDWIDEEFIRNRTVGPFLVKEDGRYLRESDLGRAETGTDADRIMVWSEASGRAVPVGEEGNPPITGSYEESGIKVSTAYQLLVDQTEEWTAEKASEITDIPAEDIVKLADVFANEGPTLCFFGFGLDHYNNGHQLYHAAAEMLAITGNFGKPGTGWSAGIAGGGSSSVFSNPNLSGEGITPGPVMPRTHALQVVETGIGAGGIKCQPRSALIYGTNYIPNHAQRQNALKYFDALDFVVVADPDMTETAHYADMVLPVTSMIEFEDLCGSQTAPIAAHCEKIIDPLFEDKSDYEIVQLIAHGMGFTDRANWTTEEFLRGYFDNDNARKWNLTYEKMKEEHYALVYPNDGLYASGMDEDFQTPSGRVEFYVEQMEHVAGYEGADMGDPFSMDQEHLAHFVLPHEAWPETVGGYEKNPLAEKYPLVYTSIRNRFRTHTQFFGCDWLLEVTPDPSLRMSPVDAEARGIKEGDLARVYNDRGEVVLRVEIHNGIRPGMVVYPKGWQEKDFIKGHTSDISCSYTIPSMYNMYHFDALCEVEKYEGGAE